MILRACIRSVHFQLQHPRYITAAAARSLSTDLSSLSPPQLDGVMMPLNVAVLCEAGPGSGKTRVLAHRAAHLLTEHEVAPTSILALTFTKRAAGEMEHRIEAILGRSEVSGKMKVSTFHSFCLDVLRDVGAPYLGRLTGSKVLNSKLKILDENASIEVLKQLVEARGTEDRDINYKKLLLKMSEIRTDQVMGLSSGTAIASGADNSWYTWLAHELSPLYIDHMHKNNVLDFDSLHLLVNQLLDIEAPRLELQQRFLHILVDEYQDTNIPQYEIVKKLCPPELLSSSEVPRSLFIVGDANQSIYEWRGAMPSNMRSFAFDYRRCIKTVPLLDNYRSTQNICKFANEVLGSEGTRAISPIDGPVPTIVKCTDDENHGEVMTAIIRKKLSSSPSKQSIVVLYRTVAESVTLKRKLDEHGILHIVKGTSMKFNHRKEVKDMLCFLQLLSDPMNVESFDRAFTVFYSSVKANSETTKRVAGEKTFEAFKDWAAASLNSDSSRFSNGYLGCLFSLLDGQESLHPTLTNVQVKRMLPFAAFLHALDQERTVKRVEELGRLIVEKVVNIKYLATLSDTSERAEQRLTNVHEVLKVMSRFGSGDLTTFLDEVLSNMSEIGPIEHDDDKPIPVQLMTIHASKGLEFDLVILTGAEEYTLNRNSMDKEQRRLAYVGVTRAKSQLFVLYRHRLSADSTETMQLCQFFKGNIIDSSEYL